MTEAFVEEYESNENHRELHITDALGGFAVDASYEPSPARIWGTSRNISGRDSVNLYLEEIAKTSLLDAEQEVELSKRIEAGVYARHLLDTKSDEMSNVEQEELEWLANDGHEAQIHFVNANLRLVVSVARKYVRSSVPLLDRIQEGNAGLMHAVEKFDYTKGYKFSTYANWWIRQAINRGIGQQSRLIRLPVHAVEEIYKIDSISRMLELELGREPTPEEIAAETGFETQKVYDLKEWSKEPISMDTPIGDGDATIGDVIDSNDSYTPENVTLANDARERLDQLIGQLDERKATIIQMRYGLVDGRNYTYRDIGRAVGISAERTRQLERDAMEKLRELADPDLAN